MSDEFEKGLKIFGEVYGDDQANGLRQFLDSGPDTFGKLLLPQFAMMMIYLVMALVLIFRPSGLMPARRFTVSG